MGQARRHPAPEHGLASRPSHSTISICAQASVVLYFFRPTTYHPAPARWLRGLGGNKMPMEFDETVAPAPQAQAGRAVGAAAGFEQTTPLSDERVHRFIREDADGLVGRQRAHFRVLATLGGGGMGTVYCAEDVALERTVALKVLPEDLIAAAPPAAHTVLHKLTCVVLCSAEGLRQSTFVWYCTP